MQESTPEQLAKSLSVLRQFQGDEALSHGNYFDTQAEQLPALDQSLIDLRKTMGDKNSSGAVLNAAKAVATTNGATDPKKYLTALNGLAAQKQHVINAFVMTHGDPENIKPLSKLQAMPDYPDFQAKTDLANILAESNRASNAMTSQFRGPSPPLGKGKGKGKPLPGNLPSGSSPIAPHKDKNGNWIIN